MSKTHRKNHCWLPDSSMDWKWVPYIPGALEGKDLENVPFLISLKKYFCHNLTSLFMQFTERYFAKKCDKNHISTVQSCLTRVPATLNTKHTVNDTFQEVRVIQRWDGVRANLNCLIRPRFVTIFSGQKNKDTRPRN